MWVLDGVEDCLLLSEGVGLLAPDVALLDSLMLSTEGAPGIEASSGIDSRPGMGTDLKLGSLGGGEIALLSDCSQ